MQPYFPEFASATRYEATLGADDSLLVPAFWFVELEFVTTTVAVEIVSQPYRPGAAHTTEDPRWVAFQLTQARLVLCVCVWSCCMCVCVEVEVLYACVCVCVSAVSPSHFFLCLHEQPVVTLSPPLYPCLALDIHCASGQLDRSRYSVF